MKALASLLIVLGVCFGALGASGFHTPIRAAGQAAGAEDPPSSESGAWISFLVGVVLLGAGGGLARAGRASAGAEGGEASVLQSIRAEVEVLRDAVVALEARRADAAEASVRTDLDDLLSGPYFDLTSKSDDVIALLGFDAYARVWEGIANAERLLARAWSMSSDGHHAEGMEELPIARSNLDRAVEELRRL